jgi:hypothetical protein
MASYPPFCSASAGECPSAFSPASAVPRPIFARNQQILSGGFRFPCSAWNSLRDTLFRFGTDEASKRFFFEKKNQKTFIH